MLITWALLADFRARIAALEAAAGRAPTTIIEPRTEPRVSAPPACRVGGPRDG